MVRKFISRLFAPLNRDAVPHGLPDFARGSEIPRIIHQTFPTKNLPPQFQANARRLQAMNPAWKYALYDDSDILEFIATAYGPKILSYYKRINPKYGAVRADLFRYLLLYKLGGVYLDIKSTLARPIDDVLRPGDQYLLAGWRNGPGEEHEGYGIGDDLCMVDGGEFQQWHIIAAPGHPFLKAAIDMTLTNIDRYKPSVHGTGFCGTMRLAGPIAYTLSIHPLLPLHPHRRVRTDAELGLVYSVMKSPHKVFFKTHYSDLREPVIKMGVRGRVIDLLYNLKERISLFAKKLRPWRHGPPKPTPPLAPRPARP